MWLGRDSIDRLFETFELTSRNGTVELDSDVKEKITTKGFCLGATYKTSRDDNISPFIITAWDCKTKLSVVCEKEPTKFLATNTQKPTFPCISDKQKQRKKRQDFDSNLGMNPNSELLGQSRVNKESNLSRNGSSILNRSKKPASTGRDGPFQNTSNSRF